MLTEILIWLSYPGQRSELTSNYSWKKWKYLCCAESGWALFGPVQEELCPGHHCILSDNFQEIVSTQASKTKSLAQGFTKSLLNQTYLAKQSLGVLAISFQYTESRYSKNIVVWREGRDACNYTVWKGLLLDFKTMWFVFTPLWLLFPFPTTMWPFSNT